MHPWLTRVRHDLVKRAVWPARDLREAGRQSTAADVAALRAGVRELAGPDGDPLDARSLWALLREAAPGVPEEALDVFGAAVDRAQAAVDTPQGIDALLALQPAFDALARSLKTES